jgi:hypothetical protein
MKKLPVGIYTFSEIINENYLYIDKTKIALNLINNNKYVFLSRPRRFGKSLFLDTLKEIFSGNKELFKGLYIYDKWSFENKYPVIKISFANGKVKNRVDLENRIITILKENQDNLNLKCYNINDVAGCFRELIIKSYEKYNEKVVILIDEYDKPILDSIDLPEIASEIREGIASFYSVIKGSDEFLKFAFLTGVSKFTKTSIFSGLNNITDITLNPNYGNICGYTQYDIETSFLPYLDGVDLDKLKNWYNGYNFLKDKVYNPYNILLFIQNGKLYKNYWFETGTPTFLMKLIQNNNYFLPKLSDLKVGEELLNSFDVENIKVETLFWQTGYLTINQMIEKSRGGFNYSLKIPNKEVEISLNDLFINYLTNQVIEKTKIQDDIYNSLLEADLKEFKNILSSMFSSLPYNNYVNNNISSYEGYYASVIYAYLSSLGLSIIAEDVTNKGRIDLTVILNDKVYILEFKVLNSTPKTNTALKQIEKNEYHGKYMQKYKEVYLLGIIFNEKSRNIVKFNYKKAK